MKASPAPMVEAWLAAQDGASVFLTTISEGELLFGVAILPEGKRRDLLLNAVQSVLDVDFHGRILAFDRDAAAAYANIAAARRAAGRPISQADCQIAAIARVHGAAVATRNARDFEGCGIAVVNPWSL